MLKLYYKHYINDCKVNKNRCYNNNYVKDMEYNLTSYTQNCPQLWITWVKKLVIHNLFIIISY